jgi:hypothetical protein
LPVTAQPTRVREVAARHRGQQRPRLEDGPIVAPAERGEVVHAPAMVEARLVRDPPHRPVLLDRGVLAELEAIAQ